MPHLLSFLSRSSIGLPKPLLITNVSFLHFLTTRSLSSPKDRRIDWNTTHTFVLSNPLLSLLEKCNSMSQLKQIQAQMVITGLILDSLASSRLIAFCSLSEHGSLVYSKTLLGNIPHPNAFSWNVAIRGFLESPTLEEAIALYKLMLQSNESRPDNYTYPLVLKCCARLLAVDMGHEILGHVIQLGFDSDIYVHNGVIHMLVSCGELDVAHKVFAESRARDLVTWNSLINGYVHSGRPHEALKVYREMEVDNIEADEVTMIGVVSSCTQLEDLELGREFHCHIEDNGLKLTMQLGNALIDMYAKCGDLEAATSLFEKLGRRNIVSWTTMVVGHAKFGRLDEARRFFDEMPEKDVVPWNALIGGYVRAKRFKEALTLFHEMQTRNVKPDEVTMVSCLSTCSQLGALNVGNWIHYYIEKHEMSINVALGTALVDMYAKCGNISKALQVFHEMQQRNSFTWTSIIGGLALHGNANDALSYFRGMIDAGLKPDEVTFLGVLSACCHGGLVDDGRKFFSQMSSKYNLAPRLKHYSCMVDLYGRAGNLDEAEDLIKSMPMEGDAVVWGALFFACRMHKNVEMGERAALKLLVLDPHDSGTYVMLASMYVEANMWEKAREVRVMMREKGVDKTPGCSSIEMDGNVFEFIIRDKSNPQCKHIYECLNQLTKQLELVEYMSTAIVFYDSYSLFGS